MPFGLFLPQIVDVICFTSTFVVYILLYPKYLLQIVVIIYLTIDRFTLLIEKQRKTNLPINEIMSGKAFWHNTKLSEPHWMDTLDSNESAFFPHPKDQIFLKTGKNKL